MKSNMRPTHHEIRLVTISATDTRAAFYASSLANGRQRRVTFEFREHRHSDEADVGVMNVISIRLREEHARRFLNNHRRNIISGVMWRIADDARLERRHVEPRGQIPTPRASAGWPPTPLGRSRTGDRGYISPVE